MRIKNLLLIVSVLATLAWTSTWAASHTTSANVALIPNESGWGSDPILGPYGGGTGGTLQTGWFPGYNIVVVPPGDVQALGDLNAYDTVILYQFCNVNNFNQLTTVLIDWLQTTGGKLMIWDSDSCYNNTYYSWLTPLGASFDRFSPGQTGSSGGSLTILDNNGLGSSDPASPYFIDTATLVSSTDAVGDLNVVDENTVSPVWCAHMRGVNVQNRSGFGHMYTKIGGLTGAPDALIIYCGLDTDYIDWNPGGPILQKLLTLELAHGWGPPGSSEVADLGCQAPIGNLALTPVTAQNSVGASHTVTAKVTLYDSSSGQTVPQQNIVVAILIVSGPNAGLASVGTSDVNGEVAFTYTGAGGAGTDVIQATATVNGVLKTVTAEKEWISSNRQPIAICQDIAVPTDPGSCEATVLPHQCDRGSYDPDAEQLVCTLSPPGPYPIGITQVTMTVTDPEGETSTCTAAITVLDAELPDLTCPDPITVGNDPGLCSAVVTWSDPPATDNCGSPTVVCQPASGSVFPVGESTVECAATDGAGNQARCSFTVRVEDREAPLAACVPTTNPSGNTIPKAGNNPKAGQNPDGFYQLLCSDNCAGAVLYIADAGSGFVAGPFDSAAKVKITQAPGVTPGYQPMAGAVIAHLQLKGDALLQAVDAAGNLSTICPCLVAPPPK